MVNIQSPTAEIRRGKKEERKKKKNKPQHKNIMAPLLHRAAINIYMVSLFHRATINSLISVVTPIGGFTCLIPPLHFPKRSLFNHAQDKDSLLKTGNKIANINAKTAVYTHC